MLCMLRSMCDPVCLKAQSVLLMCMYVCKLMGLGSPRQSCGSMSCAAHQCAMKSSWCGFCLKIWAIMIAEACISMSYVLCGSFLSIGGCVGGLEQVLGRKGIRRSMGFCLTTCPLDGALMAEGFPHGCPYLWPFLRKHQYVDSMQNNYTL